MSLKDEKNERLMEDIWDWQTRVLHWLIALLVISLVLLILGKEGMEAIGIEKSLRAPVKKLHNYVGYAFVFVFTLRIIWGFAGNKYARWKDIMPYGKERWQAIGRNIRWYLGGFKGSPAAVKGHDPLASLFYIAIFLVLASQSVTGLLLSGLEYDMMPGTILTGGLGEEAAEELADVLEEIHEFGLWFTIFYIGAHLAGLVAHELKEKTGLFSSMVHGKKYFPKD